MDPDISIKFLFMHTKFEKANELQNTLVNEFLQTKSKVTSFAHFMIYTSEVFNYEDDVHLDNRESSRFKDFSRKFILVLKRSRVHHQQTFFRKTYWVQRKYRNKFLLWHKKNKTFEKVSLIPLWFISVYFGMALSREESEKMIKSGLVNVDNKQIRNPNKTIKKWQVVRLALPHPSSYWIEKYRDKKFKVATRVSNWKRIKYLNILSQWKDLKKKYPKEIFSLLYDETCVPAEFQVNRRVWTVVLIKSTKNVSALVYKTNRSYLDN